MEVALVILDGWGLGPDDDPRHRNAVAAADTPNMEAYSRAGASGRLTVSGRDVGLPNGQMGNSEVGHLNIGAGRIVYHEYTRINDAIRKSDLAIMGGAPGTVRDPPFDRNSAILEAFERTEDRVHLMGLVSDGGVHADIEHFYALLELASQHDIDAITHVFTDGRDTDPTDGIDFVAYLEKAIETYDTGTIGSVSGRYYAMDRDHNWERTARAYDAIVTGTAEYDAESGSEAVQAAYDRDETDEFIVPTTIGGGRPIHDGESAIVVNFRADRARQLTRMLGGIDPDGWTADGIHRDPPDVAITTMTEYDRTFPFPVAFEPDQPTETIGAVWEATGVTQLRIAESEKYAHVTYFLNGGREVAFESEIRRIVESPDVPTYDQQPEMSAPAVTDTAIDVIESEDPDAMVLNYANPDMVGHTGDFEAAVTAVETVDTQLGRLLEAVQAAGGHTLVTADHGNADDMGTPEAPHTAHTTNDVPVIYLAPDGTDGGRHIERTGILADLAPTVLSLMDIEQPEAMTGTSLLS